MFLVIGELVSEYDSKKQEAHRAEEETNAGFQKKKEVKKVSTDVLMQRQNIISVMKT